MRESDLAIVQHTYQVSGTEVLKTDAAGNTVTVYRQDGAAQAQDAGHFAVGWGIMLLAVGITFVWNLVKFIQFLKEE